MQSVRTNLKINASSQYTSFNFNSMCMFNGVVIGSSDEGLFKCCCGDDDNGTDIDAYFIPVRTNFGTTNIKRCWWVYFGFETNGDMALEITGDEETTTDPYEIPYNLEKGQQGRKVPVSKMFTWTYGEFKFSNTLGCNFTVDSIDVFLKTKVRGRG